MLRIVAVLALALSAGTASAQQSVNPKPMSDEERAQINAQRRAGCKAHKENLAMLQGSGKLMIEERGKQRELSQAERDAQVAETKRVLEQYCKD